MKTLGPGFVAEFNKHKSAPTAPGASSGSGKPAAKAAANTKKPPKSCSAAKAAKKEVAASGSSPQCEELHQEEMEDEGEEEEEEEEEGSAAGTSRARAAPYNRLLREELLNCGTVLQISNLPSDGFSEQDIKKIVQPFGKVSDLILLRSRNKAYLEMNYKEAVMAAVKYGETVPVLVNGKQVKISVAEKPKAGTSQPKTGVKKKPRLIRKVPPSTRKHPTSTKAAKPTAGKKDKAKKPIGPKEGKGKKSSGTAAHSASHDPKSLPVSAEVEQQPEPVSAAQGDSTKAGAAHCKAVASAAPFPDKPAQLLHALPLDVQNEALTDGGAAAGMVKSEEGAELGSTDADDVCVVLVSNLPDKGHSVEEVSNLAKPFGGLRDVLIVSSHKQAYLEINRRSAESMVKFYSCFPMTLDGNQLGISLTPQHSTLKDEEAIFTSIIKDSDPKVNPTTLQQHFVHLGNLPSGGYRDLEVVCVGLRFGKVEHYVVLKNRNKAILQLESPKAARSMFCFLNQYSYTMGEHTLTCALSPGRQQVDPEAVKQEVKQEEPSRGRYPEGSGAAAHPAVEPSVKKDPTSIPAVKDELPEVKTEPSEPQLDGAGRDEPHWDGAQQDPAAGHAPSSNKAGAELSTAPSGLNGAELPAAKAEEKLLHPCMDKELVDGAACKPGSAAQKGRGLGAAGLGAAGRTLGAVHKAVPAAVTHSNVKVDGANRAHSNEQTEAEQDKQAALTAALDAELEAGVATGRTLDANGAGATVDGGAGGAAMHGANAAQLGSKGEQSKAGAAGQTKSMRERKGGASRATQSRDSRAAKGREGSKAAAMDSSAPSKEHPAVPKVMLKAVVSVPDILRSKAAPCKARPQGAAMGQKKGAMKDGGQHSNSTAQQCNSKSSNGRSATQQGKEPQETRAAAKQGQEPRDATKQGQEPRDATKQGQEPRDATKQGQEPRDATKQGQEPRDATKQGQEPRDATKQGQDGDSRSSTKKGSNGSNGGSTRTCRSSSTNMKEEDELFPFNLDEFVTVDEVLEDGESPIQSHHSQPKAKRKESSRGSSEPGAKRRKERSLRDGQPSFLMLDEIGGELGTRLGMLVVDEVMEDEEEQGEPRGDGQRSMGRPLKAEPLVTVDEIGEVEELPLNEPTELSGDDGMKHVGVSEEPCPVPDDPSAMVTVDEINEDNEDEEDFMADFNRLKEELNFVTVDEVGEEDEEEEGASMGRNQQEGDARTGPGEEDDEGVTGPQETEEPQGAGNAAANSKGLDYLQPKAGFFCQICSLFYSDEPSVKNHCRTAMHQHNAQRFMATRKEEGGGGAEPGPR